MVNDQTGLVIIFIRFTTTQMVNRRIWPVIYTANSMMVSYDSKRFEIFTDVKDWYKSGQKAAKKYQNMPIIIWLNFHGYSYFLIWRILKSKQRKQNQSQDIS